MYGRRRSSDNDDEPSEATMIFNKEMFAGFRKAVPLPEEKSKMSVLGRMSLAPSVQVRGKLNFDETFEEKSTTARMSEAILENKKTLRMYNDAVQEKEKYKTLCQTLSNEKKALQAELAEANEQMLNYQNDLTVSRILNDSITDRENADNWKEVANKYATWFKAAQTQLTNLCSTLSADNLLTRKLVDKIALDASSLEKADFCEGDLEKLLTGSITDFPNPPFNQFRIIEPVVVNKEFSFARPGSSSVREPLSPITDTDSFEPEFADRSSFLDSTILNISADAEKDDRICRLEHENSLLLDRMKVANYRASKSMVLEEQNRTLQLQCKTIQEQLSKTMADCESQRSVSAQLIQDGEKSGIAYRQALDFNDRLRISQTKVAELDIELAASIRQCEALIQERASLQRENGEIRETIEHKNSLIGNLESNIAYEKSKIAELQKELNHLSQELQSCEQRAAAAGSSTAVEDKHHMVEPTDAGDTTQIFHIANNPLFAAHQQHLLDENRKRKATDLNETNSTKRAKDEEIEALKAKILRSEKEKKSAIDIHKNYSKKYKEIVTVLTGYQVKATDLDEGECSVKSIYDNDTQFYFKYHSNTKGVDLLDVRQNSNSQEVPYCDNMRRYIGERQSVPAFLASVTMHLEEQREMEMEEDINSHLHTCSYLHHHD